MTHRSVDLARRRLLRAGAVAAGAGMLYSSPLRAAAAGAGIAATGAAGMAPVLRQLNYGQVRLAPGPLQRQAQQTHQRVLGLDEDALLRPFRVRAGLAAPGRDLGGWYDTYAFAPGATFGHWVSALSRHYAITGDAATRDKVHRLVRGYAATVDPGGRFYVDNRFPSYIYDKLVGALVDARTLAGDGLALPTLARATSAALPYLPPHAMPRNEHAAPPQDFTEHAWDESYTIPENQFLAYRVSGDARHAALARRFLYDDFFAPLARGDNVLPGKHAYSHVNGLSSAAQAYLSLGSTLHLDAARNGFAMVAAQSYATGGWGPDEHFIEPGSGALGASLTGMHKSFETPCGAYAHLKLARYLLRITRDPAYGDSMERVLYNTVLGALPLQPDGHAFYYSDYARDATKDFHPDLWPCCSGTLPVVTADYSISTCFTDAEGIYVNLYVPADVAWRQDGARCGLRIDTDYPYAGAVRITLAPPAERTFTLRLRIPGWAQGAELWVNGRREPQALQPGSFAALRRAWRPRDVVELQLPLVQRLEAVDAQHPDTVALLRGPLVLMPLRDAAGAPAATPAPAVPPLPPVSPALAARPERAALVAASPADDAAHEWRAATDGRPLRLRPFADIGAEPYSAYVDVRPG